jgi:hypothetical protein
MRSCRNSRINWASRKAYPGRLRRLLCWKKNNIFKQGLAKEAMMICLRLNIENLTLSQG